MTRHRRRPASAAAARLLATLLLAAPPLATTARAVAATGDQKPVAVLAAENVYGDIAGQVGGDLVSVDSVLTNPNQDPHTFEASPSVARRVADAGLILETGAGYDPWMNRLVAAAGGGAASRVIDVGRLIGRHDGDNPHLWADPAAIRALARAFADRLSALVPAARRPEIAARLERLDRSLDEVDRRIAAIRAAHGGDPVTATEPVFGPMATRLGLDMRNLPFQFAVMNSTEPTPREVAAMEDDLRARRVRILFNNAQVSDDESRRLAGIAHAAGVPTVPVFETEPASMNYQHWMLAELDATDRALGSAH